MISKRTSIVTAAAALLTVMVGWLAWSFMWRHAARIEPLPESEMALAVTETGTTCRLGKGSEIEPTLAETPKPIAVFPGAEWARKPPAELGMAEGPIEKLATAIRQGEHGAIHSLLVVRDGYLVFEEYFGGYPATRPNELQSTTKTIAALLTGIAIEQGYFKLGDPVMKLVSESYVNDGDARRQKIRVQDVLTMRVGMDWKEWNVPMPERDANLMIESKDWIQYMLDRPMKSEPGSEFQYNTGASVLLAGIIRRTTHLPAERFADENLFTPIGVRSQMWRAKDAKGTINAGGGLMLTSRDMARVGWLVASNGKWNEKQVVPSRFLDRCFTPSTEKVGTLALNGEAQPFHFGCHAWIIPVPYQGKTITVRATMGTGGQYIFILPEFRTVVVSTAWNAAEPAQSNPVGWIKSHLMPALLAAKPGASPDRGGR